MISRQEVHSHTSQISPRHPRDENAKCSPSRSHSAPGAQIDGAHRDAENVGRDEPELCGANANDADDDAVDRRQCPAFPAAASHQNCGRNGQHTGQIIEPKHNRIPPKTFCGQARFFLCDPATPTGDGGHEEDRAHSDGLGTPRGSVILKSGMRRNSAKCG